MKTELIEIKTQELVIKLDKGEATLLLELLSGPNPLFSSYDYDFKDRLYRKIVEEYKEKGYDE